MPAILAEISPTAAKIYLALSTLTRPNSEPPTAQISLHALSELTTLSARTCTDALRELLTLQLIARRPTTFHAPRIYEILPFPYTQPAATLPPVNSHPAATLPPSNSHRTATLPPTNSHPIASPMPKNPSTAPKPPHSHPVATHTNLMPTPAEEALLTDPHFLQLLIATLSPTHDAGTLAAAKATLARVSRPQPAEAPP
ncbi:MAG TPA: hypothetical protein VM008_05345 [Phycisphaerae bacterium]|nr:hypothetical protein [Phycisphaerae bacterium]